MTRGHVDPLRRPRWQRGPLDYAGPWWFLAALYVALIVSYGSRGVWWVVALDVALLAYMAWSLRDVYLAGQIARRGCLHPAHPSRLCGCTSPRRRRAAETARLVERARAVLERWDRANPLPLIPTQRPRPHS